MERVQRFTRLLTGPFRCADRALSVGGRAVGGSGNATAALRDVLEILTSHRSGAYSCDPCGESLLRL